MRLRLEELEDRLAPAGTANLFLNVGTVASPANTIAVVRGATVPVFIDFDGIDTGPAVVSIKTTGSVTFSYNGTSGGPITLASGTGGTTAASFQSYIQTSFPDLSTATVTGNNGGPFTVNIPAGTFSYLLTATNGTGNVTVSTNNGIGAGFFYILYDPTVLSISETAESLGTDFKLGSLLSGFPANYSLFVTSGFAPGVAAFGVNHVGTTFVTGLPFGHIAEVDFHVVSSTPLGRSTLLDFQGKYLDSNGFFHQPSFKDTGAVSYKLNPNPADYTDLSSSNDASLTQSAVSSPSTFNPADTDATDVSIQVVSGNTVLAPTAVADTFNTAPNSAPFPTTMAVAGTAYNVLANDTSTANGPMYALLTNTNTIATTLPPMSIAIAGASETGMVVTITTAGPNNFTPGESISISGVNTSGYDGTFEIATVDPATNSFTYVDSVNNGFPIVFLQPDPGGDTEVATTASTTIYHAATAHGQIWLNALDGTFAYTPTANYTGTDSFTYEAVDAASNTASDNTTVTIYVGGVLNIPQTGLGSTTTGVGGQIVVPVNILNPNPVNSGGLDEVVISINYDASVFDPNNIAMNEGSVNGLGGWTQFSVNTNVSGQIIITTSDIGGPPLIFSTTGGTLATITFNVIGLPDSATGTTVVNLSAVSPTTSKVLVDAAEDPVALQLTFPVADNLNFNGAPGADDGLVQLKPRTITTTTVTAVAGGSPVSTITYGTAIAFTATVSSASGTSAPTLGGVEFMDGSIDLGPGVDPTVSGNNLLFTKILTATQLQVIQTNGGVHTITAIYSAGSGFNGSTGTLAGGIQVTRAPFTITALTNTKTYDSTTSAAAIPTITGLVGSDSVTALTESYNNASATSFVIGPTPNSTITGLLGPQALAFDSAGNLFVANQNNTVVEFAPGATTPSATLTGLIFPFALAFDASGNLYVANFYGNTVSKFTPGATSPSATLTGLDSPNALAFDASGNLYVSNSGGTVSKFAPGAIIPTATLTGLDNPRALAVDANGNLFVANSDLGGNVSEFAPGATTPSATISDIFYPNALAFDSVGYLYAANVFFSTVSKFAPGATMSTFPVLQVGRGPDALAFNRNGNLFVSNSNDGTISEFAPGATSAFATLTGLSDPHALAFDPAGNLFVANLGGDTVSEFPRSIGELSSILSVGAYSINDGNNGNNYNITIVNALGIINPAPLTITAIPNTKGYDSTTTAAAVPTVSAGLIGGDTISGLGEVYADENAGTGKTLSVSAYTIKSGTIGDNYAVTKLTNTTGMIVKAALTITATTNTKTYDSTISAGSTPSVTGLIANDTVTGLSEVYNAASASATAPTALLPVVAFPQAMAFDAAGDLYVASEQDTISIFLPGATTPRATLTGVDDPTALAFDLEGNLYVTNYASPTLGLGGGNTVSIFAPGAATPTSTLTVPIGPYDLVFDTSGNLYISSPSLNTVSKFAPGATVPTSMLTGLHGAQILTVDSAGNLYVTSGSQNAAVSMFKPGATTPTATLTGGLEFPSALTCDASGNLYVANGFAFGTVSKFTPGATTASAQLGGLDDPQGLAVDAAGNVYVANAGAGTVSRFAAGATVANITFTGLGRPAGLAFDASGILYVSDVEENVVAKFPDASTAPNEILSVSAYTVQDGNGGNNYAVTTLANDTGVINKAPLIVAGIVANNKRYDGTSTATLNTSHATLQGIFGADEVTLDTTGATGAFQTTNVGTALMASVFGLTIEGAQQGNYLITQPTTTANIAPAALTVSGIIANNKVYDATTLATLNVSGAVLIGIFAGDSVNTIAATGSFVSKNAGMGVPVTVTGATLGGPQAGDYTLGSLPAATADITPAPLTVTAITSTKTYDSTTNVSAIPTVAGLLGSDSATGLAEVFSSDSAGSGRTLSVSGYTINDGNGGKNYTVTTLANTTGAITTAPLTITAVANTKGFDNMTSAAAIPTASGLQGGDSATGLAEVYSDPNVGTGKTLSVSAYTLNDGNLGNNYTVSTAINTNGVITFSTATTVQTSSASVVYGTSVIFTIIVTATSGSALMPVVAWW